VLGTRDGWAVRFDENDVRAMGRSARGVRGIDLRGEDRVVDLVVTHEHASLLTVCENGFGKRTQVSEYRKTRRGGKGVINIKATDRNGKVVALKSVTDNDDLMFISAKGIVLRTESTSMREIGRATQGVRLIRLEEGDKVVAVARIIPEDDDQQPPDAEASVPGSETASVEADQPSETEASAERDGDANPSDADTYGEDPAQDDPEADPPSTDDAD